LAAISIPFRYVNFIVDEQAWWDGDIGGWGQNDWPHSHFGDFKMRTRWLCLSFQWLSVCCVLAVAVAAQADDTDTWPEFRGPTRDGHTTATRLPIEFSPDTNVAWKTPIPGKAWSSPVIRGNRIWMTNATEDGKRLSLLTIDRATGKILSDLTLYESETPAYCHPFNSYASATPVLDGPHLYAHFGSAGTCCVDVETNQIVWSRTDFECDHHRGAGSSPVLFGQALILTFDGIDVQYLAAVDKLTGKTLWRRDRGVDFGTDNGDAKKAYSTPTVFRLDDRDELVSSFAGYTAAYDPLTGEEIWHVRHGGMNAAMRPLLAHNLLYLNTEGGDHMLAIKAQKLHGDVTSTHLAWKNHEGVPKRSGYLIDGDLLFMVNDSGVASCLDAKTGKRHWQQRLGGKYTACPILSEGKLYFFAEDGQAPVIKAQATYESLAENRFPEGFMASPAALEHALYVRSKTHLYRFEAK
jgi:outer membrane protein assembly factor BamB